MDNVIKVHSLQVDFDNYKSFVPKDLSVSVRCKGKPLNWQKPLQIEVDEDDLGMPEADISLLNIGSFLITDTIYQDYFAIYSSDFEALPVICNDRPYVLINVTRVIDCLDKEQSQFNEFGGVKELVFDSDKLPESGFFKITEDNCTNIYCMPDVVDLINKEKLTGVEF